MTLQKFETQGRHLLSQEPRAITLTQSGRLSQQQTEILTRAHMAVLMPREWGAVQGKLLLACQNPDFTKEAVYRREAPNGEVHEGLSIRFAEIALSLIRNVSVDNTVESEDDLAVHYRLTVADTEGNSTSSKTYRVSKTVERLGVRDDEIVVAERRNGKGQQVFLVPATDEQISSRAGAQESRVKRQLVLALIPADIRAACLAACLDLNKSKDATDPAAAVKSLVLEFLAQGIETADLKEYLGKPAPGATPAEIQALRGILTALREGTTTWREVMEAKSARSAQKSAKEAFVAQKQQEKAAAAGGAKRKPAAAGATGGASAGPGDEAPKRRGRRTNAQIAADNAAAEAAKSGGTTGAATTPTATDAASATTSAAAPKPQAASRRRDDEEDEEDEEDEDNTDENDTDDEDGEDDDGEGSAAEHLDP